MAMFLPGETPSDEPFTEHLTPMEVATQVQSALSALWWSAAAGDADARSMPAIERAARQTFDEVERWWLSLRDRSGVAIVSASQAAFGMPLSVQAQGRAGTLTLREMARWIPRESFAGALLNAWLLQPEGSRTPHGTAERVRRILDRQLSNAADDLAAFG